MSDLKTYFAAPGRAETPSAAEAGDLAVRFPWFLPGRILRETLHTRMNLEMAVTEEMLTIACETKPHFCCLVPEKRQEVTTEGGLDVAGQLDKMRDACKRLADAGILVSLFIDADFAQIKAAADVGAPYIEIHTGCYADAESDAEQAKELYALAEKKQLFIMEAFWIRFLPLYAKLQQMLADGVIGTLQTITCQYGFTTEGARRERKFNSALGGGALLDIGIYNLGFLQMVTGQQPQNVQTEELRLTEYGTDEYSKLRLAYPSGCTAESVQTIGQRLTRMACIVGTKGRITLPDFQYAEHMTLELDGQPPQELDFPFDVNGFEYQIREVSRCAATGRHHSSIYTPQQSIALTQLMYDIRMAWGMKFEGEE
mgnify:CR=1 FL=1